MFSGNFPQKSNPPMPAAIPLANAAIISQDVNINDGLNHASIGPVVLVSGVIRITNGSWKVL